MPGAAKRCQPGELDEVPRGQGSVLFCRHTESVLVTRCSGLGHMFDRAAGWLAIRDQGLEFVKRSVNVL
jgi:hypothetical protein